MPAIDLRQCRLPCQAYGFVQYPTQQQKAGAMRWCTRVIQSAALFRDRPVEVVSPTLNDAANWRRQHSLIGAPPNHDSESQPWLRRSSPVRRAWPAASSRPHRRVQFDSDLSAGAGGARVNRPLGARGSRLRWCLTFASRFPTFKRSYSPPSLRSWAESRSTGGSNGTD
jgi:hypothetical protein